MRKFPAHETHLARVLLSYHKVPRPSETHVTCCSHFSVVGDKEPWSQIWELDGFASLVIPLLCIESFQPTLRNMYGVPGFREFILNSGLGESYMEMVLNHETMVWEKKLADAEKDLKEARTELTEAKLDEHTGVGRSAWRLCSGCKTIISRNEPIKSCPDCGHTGRFTHLSKLMTIDALGTIKKTSALPKPRTK